MHIHLRGRRESIHPYQLFLVSALRKGDQGSNPQVLAEQIVKSPGSPGLSWVNFLSGVEPA